MTGLAGTVVLEADASFDRLARKLDGAMIGFRAGRHRVTVLCPPIREAGLREQLPERFAAVEIMARAGWWTSPRLDTRLVAFLPAAMGYSWPRWELMPEGDGLVRPWVPPLIPVNVAGPMVLEPATAWIATTGLLRHLFDETTRDFGLGGVIEGLARRRLTVGYVASPSVAPEEGLPPPGTAAPGTAAPPLRRDSRVLAIVPHHRCEPWLEQCLRSLTRQTRPPDAIIVVDDASPAPPRRLPLDVAGNRRALPAASPAECAVHRPRDPERRARRRGRGARPGAVRPRWTRAARPCDRAEVEIRGVMQELPLRTA